MGQGFERRHRAAGTIGSVNPGADAQYPAVFSERVSPGFLAGYGAGGNRFWRKSSSRQRKATHLDRSPTLQPMDRNKAHPSDRGHAARQREILLIGSIDQSFF